MQSIIESAWENRLLLEKSETQEAIREVIRQLDTGKLRVASPTDGGWQVNEWVKKRSRAILSHPKDGDFGSWSHGISRQNASKKRL